MKIEEMTDKQIRSMLKARRAKMLRDSSYQLVAFILVTVLTIILLAIQ
jgi:hypothetical protein